MSTGDKVKNRGTTENTQRKQSRLLLPWERKLNEGTGRLVWSGRGAARLGVGGSRLGTETEPAVGGGVGTSRERFRAIHTHVKIIASFTSEVFRITVFLLKSYTH